TRGLRCVVMRDGTSLAHPGRPTVSGPVWGAIRSFDRHDDARFDSRRGWLMLGLVLTAGGARGAYQAGVLKRIGELPGVRDRPLPFPIVTGGSAGAINGAMVAAGSAGFHEATQRLAGLWAGLRVEDVFRTDAWSLTAGSVGLLRDVLLGSVLGHT